MNNNLLGLKIKQLRSEYSLKIGKKFTQNGLAEELGISRSYLSDIESGRTKPNTDLLNKIANFFNISPNAFDNEMVLNTSININNDNAEPINLSSDSIKLSQKAERDIQKSLSQTLDMLENSQDGLMFDGEPLDDETRELLAQSLENSMRLAKKIAKEKFTPKKYRK